MKFKVGDVVRVKPERQKQNGWDYGNKPLVLTKPRAESRHEAFDTQTLDGVRSLFVYTEEVELDELRTAARKALKSSDVE